MRSGSIILLLLICVGVVGSYRAFTHSNSLLARWHGIVFCGIPVLFLAVLEYGTYIPKYLIGPLVFIGWGHWIFSGIEVFKATEDNPAQTPLREYLRLLGWLIAGAAALGVFSYTIK